MVINHTVSIWLISWCAHRLWLDDKAANHCWWKNHAVVFETRGTQAFKRPQITLRKDYSSLFISALYSRGVELISRILTISLYFPIRCHIQYISLLVISVDELGTMNLDITQATVWKTMHVMKSLNDSMLFLTLTFIGHMEPSNSVG